MSTRISTGMVFNQSVNLMLDKQARLMHLQQQLATGQKMVTAKDDPVGAGTAVGLDRALAELERYGKNADHVQNRLGLQENALAQAGDAMARITELTVRANNPALSEDDRRAIASELVTIQDQLLSLANSTDGSGRYLFAGTADDTAPFARGGGQVTYNGDQTQRRIEIAPETHVLDAVPGSEIFMRVRTGDGTLDANADAANTGTAVLTGFGRAPGNWSGERYDIVFTSAETYELQNTAGEVIRTGEYRSGEDIVLEEGLRLRLEGAPAAGDTFAIGPSETRDVFGTLDRLIGALQMPFGSPEEKAAQQNLLQSSLRDIARASEHMIDARAAGGAQLAALDNAQALREANAITFETTLSSLRDLDYADAIGRYQIETAALQAAQTVFTQMQSMSLFDRIR
ncbi:flagellar hook-associated protein FlgL [Luteimonas abyssi]|uniref:flagellar hook-associated protein FlgL n=1 Tax=Luteimonas abyssi TaxID=1247514 RepID=UPI000737CB02|nr:flagellar hook-associated protein FlgL [Luteimonas abyssi]